MDVVGLGTAIVEVPRVRRLLERHGEEFLSRAFTEREVRHCQSRKRGEEAFAAWWAAKEAVLKALGLAPRRGAGLTDVEVRAAADGRPRVALRGPARERARTLRVADLLISTAHCRSSATATALALRGPATPTPRPG